jgi:septal ring factor EnvC (AmiA/AmiB activator)
MRTGSDHIDRRSARGRAALPLALLVACLCLLAAVAVGAPAQSLQQKFDRKQSELSKVKDERASLATTIAEDNRRVNDLIAEVAAVRDRAAEVRARLDAKQAELDRATAALERERRHLAVLKARLRRALGVLREELVAIYKSGDPDTLSVVMESASWADVVAQTEYLESMQNHYESVVGRVRTLRDQTRDAVARLRAARERIEAARDAIAADQRRIEADLAEMEQRKAELDAVRAARQSKIDALQGREAALSDNLSAIADQLASGAGTSAPENAAPAPQPGESATLLPNGLAAPPASAPAAVQAAIQAANNIVGRPYIWGGGHGSWESAGYDCSGSVSYALHGGGFLDSPLDSTGLSTWGVPGPGSWITVYANSGHAYAVIAGLRWDTSDTGGSGPGWASDLRSSAGFIARHPSGY